MKFNQNLRNLREDHDLTQSQLGRILNMTQRKISHLETGDSEPTTDEIVQICKFFNVSADVLLGIIDIPKRLR